MTGLRSGLISQRHSLIEFHWDSGIQISINPKRIYKLPVNDRIYFQIQAFLEDEYLLPKLHRVSIEGYHYLINRIGDGIPVFLPN
ncbi:uncharacterized protein SPAPADRAFT_62823, partial [Spathaspora passalidarum NRRL Y-27907]